MFRYPIAGLALLVSLAGPTSAAAADAPPGTDARRFVTLDVFTIGASPAKLASPHWKVEIAVIAAR